MQLVIVAYRLQGFLVAVQTEIPDRRAWQQLLGGGDHAGPGAQDWREADAPTEDLLFGSAAGRDDGYLLHRQVSGGKGKQH